MHLASPDSGGLNCADAMGVVVVCVGVPSSGVVDGPLHALHVRKHVSSVAASAGIKHHIQRCVSGGCSPTSTPLLRYKGVHHAVSQGRDDHEQAAIRPLVARGDDMLYAGPTRFRRLSICYNGTSTSNRERPGGRLTYVQRKMAETTSVSSPRQGRGVTERQHPQSTTAAARHGTRPAQTRRPQRFGAQHLSCGSER